MKDSGMYIALWTKFKPMLLTKMRAALEAEVDYQLSQQEFESIGERSKTGFAFTLETKDGRITNDKKGTVVGRDLFKVVNDSKTGKELIGSNDFKITMSKNFLLKFKLVVKESV